MTLRVGFLGCGVIASAHAFSLLSLAGAGLCAVEIGPVFDQAEKRCSRFADNFGGEAVGSAAEVCENADAVYICTSTAGHLAGIRAASQHHRPAFCEKPLGRNLNETQELVKAATSPVQVGLVLRSAPVFRELARIASTQEFGAMLACTWRDDQFFPIQGHYASKWRADADIAGAGVLLEHTIHDIDIIGHTLGEVKSVSARSSNHFGYKGIEDSVSALLTLVDGATVTLVTVWHDILSRGSSRRVEVIFEKAMVTFENDFSGPMTIETSATTEHRPCPSPDWLAELTLPMGDVGLAVAPYVEENRAFVDALATGSELRPNLQDAMAAHEVVDACYRSISVGAAVTTG